MTIKATPSEDQILTIFLEDAIDSATAPEAEKQIMEIYQSSTAKAVVLDAEKLSYISFSGLRVLRKLEQNLELTNAFFEEEISAMRAQLRAYIKDEAMLDELLVTGKGVYAPYMQNAIDYIKENYGDIPGYVKTELGLTDADIAKLQELYTE